MVALAILDKLCDFDIHLPDYVRKCHNYASKLTNQLFTLSVPELRLFARSFVC